MAQRQGIEIAGLRRCKRQIQCGRLQESIHFDSGSRATLSSSSSSGLGQTGTQCERGGIFAGETSRGADYLQIKDWAPVGPTVAMIAAWDACDNVYPTHENGAPES